MSDLAHSKRLLSAEIPVLRTVHMSGIVVAFTPGRTKEANMLMITDQQQRREERTLAKVLILLNVGLMVLLFTVSYLQR